MDNSNIWLIIIFAFVSFIGSISRKKPKEIAKEEEQTTDDEILAKRKSAADTFLAKMATEQPAPSKLPLKQRDKLPENKINDIDETENEPIFTDIDEVKKAIITAEILKRKF